MSSSKTHRTVPIWTFWLGLALLIWSAGQPFSVLAGEAESELLIIGRVVVAVGQVEAERPDGSIRELARRAPVYEQDTVRTGARSRVQIRFNDGARMSLRPDTEMSYDEYRYQADQPQANLARMQLRRGGFRTVTGAIGSINRQAYRVDTPYAVIGIRGTDYGAAFVETGPSTGDLSPPYVVGAVNLGDINMANDAGEVDIGENNVFAIAIVRSPDDPPEGIEELPGAVNDLVSVDIPGETPGEDEEPIGEAASDDAAPDEGEADDAAADEGEADDAAPDEGAPDEGAPDDAAPDEGVPDEGAAEEVTVQEPEPEVSEAGELLSTISASSADDDSVVFEFGTRCL